MLADQRAFKRVNIYVVGEFRDSARPEIPFFGITRDISCGGISFESQHYPLGPGDSLHCIFKDSRNERVVSSMGEIVWKKHSDKFDCLTGVRFTEVDCSPENEILKLLSAAGRVPVSTLLPGLDADRSGGNGWDQEEKPLTARNVPVSASADEEPAMPESAEASWQDSARGDGEYYGMKGIDLLERGRSWTRFYLVPALVLFLIFAVLLISHLGKRSEHDVPPEDITRDVPAVGPQAWPPASGDREVVMQEEAVKEQFTSGQASEAVKSEQDTEKPLPISPAVQPPSGEAVNGGTVYFIQVGAWKNASYAAAFLKKIKAHYPDAYLDREGIYHKIKIPHITSEREARRVISDIKEKYQISSLLVKSRDGH